MVQYIYTLGVAGERKSVTELDRTVEYTYDSLYRLTSETITEGEKATVYTYAYDSVSNRILKTENGAATEYVYNALNQLVSDSETTYEYDLNGNLVRVIGTANSALYEYNAENKLVKATVQNGYLVIEESDTYDYQGNRTSKTSHRSDGITEYVKYLNDNSSLTNVLAEVDENGTVKCTYTIGADLVSQERSGRTSIYLYDGHCSVVGLANETGVITDTYSYDAFGNLMKSTGATVKEPLIKSFLDALSDGFSCVGNDSFALISASLIIIVTVESSLMRLRGFTTFVRDIWILRRNIFSELL